VTQDPKLAAPHGTLHIGGPADAQLHSADTLKRSLLVPLAVAALARAAPFAFGFEHYGDAPVRIELAQRWAADPHLWRGYLETFQYGPLHLTFIGALLRLVGDRVLAARLLSLISGLAGVWLLHRLAERERGQEAGFWAALGLALSPLHIQASTTGASEAPFLALLLGAVLLVLRGQIVAPALLLGAAGLVRYDGWLYVPLLGGLLLWRRRDVLRTAAFAAVACVPAVLWMGMNAYWAHDPLAPIHHIDRDHAQLARTALATWGPFWSRMNALLYWPLAVCIVATPALGLLALWGSARTVRLRQPGWDLVALAWLPAAYLTFRGAVLADFLPMARFTLVSASLSLVFASDALALLARPARALSVAVAVATPSILAMLSWNRTGPAAEWARPVAPIGSLPPGIAEAASWLRANAGEDDLVLVDDSTYYLDIPLAFASGLPETKLLRARWTDDFERRFPRHSPTLAVLVERGRLGDFRSERFDFRGLSFCAAQRYTYATVYRRCEPTGATP
jgi:4-amino-4-deoxy-L-arabinose transferase-like glycosyltransferase